MPIGTCDPATRGDTYNEVTLETPLPDRSGSILTTVRYGWDGVSARPNCDGPITYIRTRNTGSVVAWSLLPNKKAGNPWVQIDPKTDVVVTKVVTLRQLGLEKYSDATGVGVTFTQPVV